MHRGEIGGTVRPKGKVQRPVGKDTGSRQVTSDKSFGYPLGPFSSPRPESEAGPLVALDGDRVREASPLDTLWLAVRILAPIECSVVTGVVARHLLFWVNLGDLGALYSDPGH